MKSTKLIWKTPKTAKAKEICDAIYIASIKVFSENYETANTNKIAQIAGVNISSLYRYFENKEAVLAYTIMRYILESRDLNLEVISQDKLIYSNEPKEFISQLFQVSIDRYRKDILFLKVMYIEGGRLGLTEEIFRIREGIAEDLARHMIDKYNLNLDIQVAQKKY